MLEDRNIIREKHGIANARRVSCASVEHSEVQAVIVTDGDGEVLLSMATSSFPAGLTPEQALMLADQLTRASGRVQNNLLQQS